MPKKTVTGKWIPRRQIEFIECIEGHVAPFALKKILSKEGVSCPFCNTPIKLSEDDQHTLEETRVEV